MNTRRRKLPWRSVAITGAIAASLFAGLMIVSQRNCEWECDLIDPWVEIALGLLALAAVCAVALVVMLGVAIWRRAQQR